MRSMPAYRLRRVRVLPRYGQVRRPRPRQADVCHAAVSAAHAAGHGLLCRVPSRRLDADACRATG